jgi:hypothetical protein
MREGEALPLARLARSAGPAHAIAGASAGKKTGRRPVGCQGEGKCFLFFFFICLFNKLFQIRFFKPKQNKINPLHKRK